MHAHTQTRIPEKPPSLEARPANGVPPVGRPAAVSYTGWDWKEGREYKEPDVNRELKSKIKNK